MLAVISLVIVGAVLLVLTFMVLTGRSLGGGGAKRALCGGCRRMMMPVWSQCRFCGWERSRPAARLEFVGGPLAGQTVPLVEEVTTIGSVQGNTIVLADPGVSRKHLGIRRMSEGFELADLGSTNGVYVNGHRMGKKLLEPGDIMRVGTTEIVFRVE